MKDIIFTVSLYIVFRMLVVEFEFFQSTWGYWLGWVVGCTCAMFWNKWHN